MCSQRLHPDMNKKGESMKSAVVWASPFPNQAAAACTISGPFGLSNTGS